MKWKDVSIQNKILAIGILIIVVFSISVFGYIVPSIETAVFETKKEEIKSLVDMTVSSIDGMAKGLQEGTMTEEELKANVIEYVKHIRYGPENKDYMWINDFHPSMVMHPYVTDLNGKDLTDYMDKKGKRQFVDMVKVCRLHGSGYVDYLWQYKDDTTRIEPKISYVKAIPQLNWILGAGVYEYDIKEGLKDRMQSLQLRIAGLIAAITLFLFLFVYNLSRSIKKQIIKCVNFAKGLSEGDIMSRIDLNQKDEFGKLSHALNAAADDLEKLIGNVMISSQNLVQAVDQISSGNQNLSQRTSEQASSLEEIASTTEEAAAIIRQNAENSFQAKTLVEDTSRIANETKDLSSESVKLAEEGGGIVRLAVDSIAEVNNASKKIGEIIAVINEIAFQTNLLALNAAVEAARAGEQGRGFAVVAGEVRNLAQRSSAASKEISVLINDSMEKVARGTDSVNKSGIALGEIIKSSRRSEEALNSVLESIRKAVQNISEIAVASEEQRVGIDQINTAITEMDTMTQQNASLVEETAAASEEMSNQAQELLSLMDGFKIRHFEDSGNDGMKHHDIHIRAAEGAMRGSGKGNGDGKGRVKRVLGENGFTEF